MPPSRSITSELLSRARNGQLSALERLDELVTPETMTVGILEIAFKHLKWEPASFSVYQYGRKQVLPPGAGAVPAVCLRLFWKAVSAAQTKDVFVDAIMNPERLEESMDGVCEWIRFCLPFLQHQCLPAQAFDGRSPTHREKYIAQARLLLQLFPLDYHFVFRSSKGLIDLFIDIFVTEDGGGTLKDEERRCFMDVSKAELCPIVDLAHRILTNEEGLDMFLRRMEIRRNYPNFCFGITNRLTRECYAQVQHDNPSGILMSVDKLLEATADLCAFSTIFPKQLTQWDHLSSFSWILNVVANFMAKPTVNATPQLNAIIPMIDTLCEMVYQTSPRSTQIRYWSDLLSGDFIRLFMCVTVTLKKDSDPRWLNVLLNLETLGAFMVFPNILERCPRMTADDFALSKLGDNPTVITMWSRFWKSLDWAQRVQDVRKGRASVDICDYASCASVSSPDLTTPRNRSKQCSGCWSVVYCSPECQMNDWQEWHNYECKRARAIHSKRRTLRTQYSHAMRTLQATLVEMIYADRSLPEHGSRDNLYVLDCRSMGGLDKASYSHSLADEEAYWSRNSGMEPHTFRDQEYLKPRLASLMKAYVSGTMPHDWRVVEAIVPFTGDELGIRLTVLLKPVEGKLGSVYSLARYGY